MKKFILLLISFLSFVCSYGYDFEANGLYFNILSSKQKTCATTKGESIVSTLDGELIIPSSVNFDNNEWTVVEIGDDSFAWSKLTKVIIPESVSKIGSHAFVKCYDLKEVVIPQSVVEISSAAFCECTSLQNIKLPSNIKEILAYTFLDCKALTSIHIPTSVNRISGLSFGYCTSLSNIYINNFCTIDSSAFEGCNNISNIFVNSDTPPQCYDTDVFQGIIYMNASLYVPLGSLELYSSTSPWSEFEKIYEQDFAGICPVLSDSPHMSPLFYFDLKGKKQTHPHRGVNIILWSNGSYSKTIIF